MRLKRLAGIAGRTAATAAPFCKKFAYSLFPLVNFTGVWAHPHTGLGKQRGDGKARSP